MGTTLLHFKKLPSLLETSLLVKNLPDFVYCNMIKVRFTQKMLVKWSKCHSCEPFIAPELLFPVNGMSSIDEMLIFSFF